MTHTAWLIHLFAMAMPVGRHNDWPSPLSPPFPPLQKHLCTGSLARLFHLQETDARVEVEDDIVLSFVRCSQRNAQDRLST